MDAFIARAIKEDKKCFPKFTNDDYELTGVKNCTNIIVTSIIGENRLRTVFVTGNGVIYINRNWMEKNLTKKEWQAFVIHRLKGEVKYANKTRETVK